MRLSHRLAATLSLVALSWAAHAESPAQWQALTRDLQLSLESAIQNATQAVPGTVLEIEIDDGDGAGVRYEAEVLTPSGDSIEVWVDGSNGRALQHANDGKAKRKDTERAAKAKISMTQAIQAATQHTPGQAVKAQLDNHWGKTTYQIDVLQPNFTVMEIKVDAENGQVLRAKPD